jgi:Zn-dependent protease with chaperone function
MIAALVCSRLAGSEVPDTKDSSGRVLHRLLQVGFPAAPAPLASEEREAIWATLPASGEAELNESARSKVEHLQRILAAYKRDGAIRITVARLPYASAALYGRALLILSDHTVRILTAEELQAVVAHELGHEFRLGRILRSSQ